MRKLPIYLLACISFVLTILIPGQTKANHGAGGEIIYEWLGTGSDYRVYFKFYRDCTGPPAPDSMPLCVKNSCNTTMIQKWMYQYTGLIPPGIPNGSPVALGCSPAAFPTKCQNTSSSIPGYEEWWYFTDVTLPFQCNNWTFYSFMYARNNSDNLIAATNKWFYTETTFDNTGTHEGNSSPYFSNKPIPYVCVNVPFQFNNGAVDPNGDSLSTDVVQPLDFPGGTCGSTPALIAFNNPQPPPYPNIALPNNPIQTANTFVLNAATGQMNFIAPLTGSYTLSVRTREYRNGVLIGSIVRDVQVQVIGNCAAVPPTVNPVITMSGVTIINGQVQGCAGQELEFGYDLKSPNPNAVIIGEDNHTASIPAATTTYINQRTDSVRGIFNWTPGANQSGLFSLTVTARDSTCDPPGISYNYIFSIPIYVWPATKANADTSVCPGEPVQLSATGGGNFLWSTFSGPAGTLSCTNCPAPVATTYGNAIYTVVSQQTPFCLNNKDTVKVTMLPGPPFVPLTDIVTCPGVPNQMDLQLPPATGVNYTVTWSPGTYLNNANIENPVVTPAGDITYTVVIGATNNTCKGFDTVIVDVLDGFKINTPDTAICQGQSVTVNVTRDTRYAYSWTTTDNSGGASISDPTITNPTITPPLTGKYVYKLKAQYANCNDSLASFDIEVQPNPTVVLQEDASMCHGDTMQLAATVTPAYNYTYTWTPGLALDNPNIPNPIFKALSTTTLKMEAATSAGCRDDDEINLTVFSPDFVFASADTAICPRDTAHLAVTGMGLKSFRWSPEVNIDNATSALPSVWPEHTQLYTIYARDTNGCHDTTSVRVTVKPAAILDLPESVILYPGDSYRIEPKGNAVYYTWFPPVGMSDASISNPVVKPEVNTRYIVKATTEFNCSVTDSINIIVKPDSHIELPNAFAPGGGKTLKIIRLGEARLKTFAIFNRWGVKVFETNDINMGWDGTYNSEPQPMGVYMYMIEAESFTGRKISKQGNITLIR